MDKKLEKYNNSNIYFIKNVKNYKLYCLKYWKFKFLELITINKQKKEHCIYKKNLYKGRILQVKQAFKSV